MVNLAAQLAAAKAAWKRFLAQMHARQQYILGEQVAAFETEFGQALGARYAVTVGTGTAAIELALRDAGIQSPRQEVITTALSAPFTATAIAATGATIRFADIDPDTLLVDPASVGDRLSRRAAAIVPVHLYGQPCDLKPLRAIARAHRATLVQDACQAHGARFQAKALSDWSTYTAYSFYPTKNLGALGDGGAIVTNSKSAAARLRALRDGGRRGGQVAYVRGVNSRLDEMQACYLRAFLPHLAAWNANRARLAALYLDGLKGCDGVRPLVTSPESVWHLFVVRAARRDQLREYLARHGVASAVHYPVPLHLMPAFAQPRFGRGAFPHAEKAAREILSLPLWPLLKPGAVDRVVSTIRAFYRQ